MTTEQELQWLTQKLYPNGRAWRMPEGGDLYKFHEAINENLADLDADTLAVLDALMPDNAGFTQADADDWYRRLGLFNSGSVPFADMKLAIAQKQSFPQVPLEKQSLSFIEAQLQAAGFNVTLYRNRFFIGGQWVTQSPSEFFGGTSMQADLDLFDLNDVELNQVYEDTDVSVIANYLEEDKDAQFNFGANYRHTFFVAGPMSGGHPTQATVAASRKIEFRQLLLKLKRAEVAGWMWINYV